jgi:hypothetical protein
MRTRNASNPAASDRQSRVRGDHSGGRALPGDRSGRGGPPPHGLKAIRHGGRRRMDRYGVAGLCLSVALCIVGFAGTIDGEGIPFQGEEVEHFLAHSKIVDVKDRLRGVTVPRKATLELDGLTRFAVFKVIDVKKQGPTRLESGAVDMSFQDSWRTEVAAYEVDRMIGLGMVPATVERRHLRDRGSLQIWVDCRMSEAERIAENLQVPDAERWNQAMFKLRVFDNLIYNVDRHLNNLLITEDWRIIAIDHSRAFRPYKRLRDPGSLTRFSRSLLESLARLDKQTLKESTGRFLSGTQIEGLLARRDLILRLAEERAGELGEASVLYP